VLTFSRARVRVLISCSDRCCEKCRSLDALYRALIAPRQSGGRALTKGVLLDRVIGTLRKQGVQARRGVYIDDFIFDVVIENGGPASVLEVLSFAVPRKDWTPIERDAAHFLYALRRVNADGRAVIQPPAEAPAATASYERILRWLDDEDVPTPRRTNWPTHSSRSTLHTPERLAHTLARSAGKPLRYGVHSSS
jgi:hypothetical protein